MRAANKAARHGLSGRKPVSFNAELGGLLDKRPPPCLGTSRSEVAAILHPRSSRCNLSRVTVLPARCPPRRGPRQLESSGRPIANLERRKRASTPSHTMAPSRASTMSSFSTRTDDDTRSSATGTSSHRSARRSPNAKTTGWTPSLRTLAPPAQMAAARRVHRCRPNPRLPRKCTSSHTDSQAAATTLASTMAPDGQPLARLHPAPN